MTSRSLLIPLCAALIASPSAVARASAPAADTARASADPAAVAENFCAAYAARVEAQKDTKKWVVASTQVTANFKRTYAKAMSSIEVDADPVLMAQYVPEGGFKAGKPEIKGDRATVVLSAGPAAQRHQVTVTLVNVKGSWLLDSVK